MSRMALRADTDGFVGIRAKVDNDRDFASAKRRSRVDIAHLVGINPHRRRGIRAGAQRHPCYPWQNLKFRRQLQTQHPAFFTRGDVAVGVVQTLGTIEQCCQLALVVEIGHGGSGQAHRRGVLDLTAFGRTFKHR